MNSNTCLTLNHLQKILLLVPLLIVGCSNGSGEARRAAESISGSTMATTFSIKYQPSNDTPGIADVAKVVNDELAVVNQQMSTYLEDSEVSKFNQSQSTDWFTVSDETARVVDLALQYNRLSEGTFDVTVGPLVNAWGFGPSPTPTSPPSALQIATLLTSVGSDKLQVRLDPPALKKALPSVLIDLSAIAKGHGVDRVIERLSNLGIKNMMVEIGGEVRTSGTRADGQNWQVGIEVPDPRRRALHRTISFSNLALATSGDYRNFRQVGSEQVGHFINPKTGRPIEPEIASASVLMPDCASADAIATTLMASTLENALRLSTLHQWPVLLIVRREDQFETITTPQFEELVQY